MESVGSLVVVRCWCGIQHAVPKSLQETQLKAHDRGEDHWVYCPLGHKYAPAGESRLDKQKRQTEQANRLLARERSRHDQTRAELKTTERKRRAEKAAKTRLKNRVSKGVCPCCNRHFANLERHMQNKHPEFEQA